MDEAQRVLTKTYTKEDLMKMTADEVEGLIERAGKDIKFHGTAVVRRADGTIRYDDASQAGKYGEAPEELTTEGT